jgi:hypothetical protein
MADAAEPSLPTPRELFLTDRVIDVREDEEWLVLVMESGWEIHVGTALLLVHPGKPN